MNNSKAKKEEEKNVQEFSEIGSKEIKNPNPNEEKEKKKENENNIIANNNDINSSLSMKNI